MSAALVAMYPSRWALASELPPRHRNPARQNLIDAAAVEIDNLETPAGDFDLLASGRKALQAGDVLWSDAQTHIGENIGDTATHVIMVEMK